MVSGKIISIGLIAYVLGMSSKKLHRWYKDVLSGFKQAEESGELQKHDMQKVEQGEFVDIAVPILEQKNLGKQMAVDEKTINGTCYTVLSNRQTGKIALMAATLKTKYLVDLMSHFDMEKRMQVKSISRDMATHYDWFAREAFMNAYHVIDKFHIMKNTMEQLQAVRIYYRQQELSKRREAAENKKEYQETVLENGDSVLQLLARSRGLLFVMPHNWSQQQRQRANVLFKLFPKIKRAYQMVNKIRRWFKPPAGKITYQPTKNKKKTQLLDIINELYRSTIPELKNMAFMLKRNLMNILHYFIAKETNAKAEALNQNLQRFININYGTRNIKFFLFRIKIYFA